MDNKTILNESAFPEPFVNDPQLTISHTKGMTLRDYFAAKAMQAILTGHKRYVNEVADEAYSVADAMIKKR